MSLNIARSRLGNQRLSGTRFRKPEDVVRALGAVQAQEYPDAKWALALRMQRASEDAIESALAEGRILRTHVLRPTWHFVVPADIRWMLALTGPRVSKAIASSGRGFELDATVFRRSQRAIAKALRGGAQLTRQELKAVLQRVGVQVDNAQRLAFIVMQAELDGLICSGARRDKQFTYALLEERVAISLNLSRDEALAELTRRYFTGHGPAQLQDFMWWSGLTALDARAGVAMVERELAREVLDGRTYWHSSSTRATATTRGAACLLPIYDEYPIAYRDRSAALDRALWTRMTRRDSFSAPIVVDGQVVGGWRRELKSDRVVVSLMPFRALSKSTTLEIDAAAYAYARFLRRDLELSWLNVPTAKSRREVE